MTRWIRSELDPAEAVAILNSDPDNPCDGVKKSIEFLDAHAMRVAKLAR